MKQLAEKAECSRDAAHWAISPDRESPRRSISEDRAATIQAIWEELGGKFPHVPWPEPDADRKVSIKALADEAGVTQIAAKLWLQEIDLDDRVLFRRIADAAFRFTGIESKMLTTNEARAARRRLQLERNRYVDRAEQAGLTGAMLEDWLEEHHPHESGATWVDNLIKVFTVPGLADVRQALSDYIDSHTDNQ